MSAITLVIAALAAGAAVPLVSAVGHPSVPASVHAYVTASAPNLSPNCWMF